MKYIDVTFYSVNTDINAFPFWLLKSVKIQKIKDITSESKYFALLMPYFLIENFAHTFQLWMNKINTTCGVIWLHAQFLNSFLHKH